MIWDEENLVKVLKDGGVAVMPTDTLYGIVGRAQDSSTVERIYKIRKRSPEKPCIILIGDISDLEKFSVNISPEQKVLLQEYWSSGSVSIILDCTDEKFSYLHRGTHTLAFRLPMQAGLPVNTDLQKLLQETGPLIAPSANPEGLIPAQNIEEAKNYFGDSVDVYIDGGKIIGKASKIIKLHKDGSIDMLRP
ncbi:MAG: L-threonylcarbamoyladenylate synthase [Patescibacteria group bacterium]